MTSDADAVPTPDTDATATIESGDGSTSREQESQRTAGKLRWHERPSILTIRKRAHAKRTFWGKWDRRYNDESRLPTDDAVHLGGITLVEAFTPSTVHALYAALADLPVREPDRKQEWLSALRYSRGKPFSIGWQSLVMVRPLNEPLHIDGFNDGTLPEGVDAVWLQLHYPTASLAMVVATFSFKEDAGDLSELLRADYQTEVGDVHIHVPGRLGRLRSRLPWARPRTYSARTNINHVRGQKNIAYERVASKYQEACWRWFANRFPGRFAVEPVADRPCVRLIFTSKLVPFRNQPRSLEPLGLMNAPTVWRSTEFNGWSIVLNDRGLREKHRATIVVAARRSDAAVKPLYDESLWHLTQMFEEYHAPLVVRWAMTSLISLYADRLAELRDRAGRPRRFRRPVRQASDLDRYVLGDGLDASSVASDIRQLASNLDGFRWEVAEYSEDREEYPQEIRDKEQPLELVPTLAESLKREAERLLQDMTTTTANIGASAQLRQSIANTRLQRAVFVLTIVATVIALLSLIAAGES